MPSRLPSSSPCVRHARPCMQFMLELAELAEAKPELEPWRRDLSCPMVIEASRCTAQPPLLDITPSRFDVLILLRSQPPACRVQIFARAHQSSVSYGSDPHPGAPSTLRPPSQPSLSSNPPSLPPPCFHTLSFSHTLSLFRISQRCFSSAGCCSTATIYLSSSSSSAHPRAGASDWAWPPPPRPPAPPGQRRR
jgi:hypothetical protein